MNRLIEYSSRFRILKGGKISLMVSALALGSLVNVANAETLVFSTAGFTNKSLTEDSTLTISSSNTMNEGRGFRILGNSLYKISITNDGKW